MRAFLAENRVDERAARDLQEAPLEAQRSAILRGSLRDCWNPSAVLRARLSSLGGLSTSGRFVGDSGRSNTVGGQGAPGAALADEGSDSSVPSLPGSPRTQAARREPKLGVLYWGGGADGKGWDLSGRGSGMPRICRSCDSLADSWRGRMENVQVTLRICASEGPGFKRYIKHFLALSARGCFEMRLQQYHQYNRACRKKVLNERLVIGGVLEAAEGKLPAESGIRVSNGGQGEDGWRAHVARRSRRYRRQARRAGGHFAVVVLEGGCGELNLRELVGAAERSESLGERPARIARLLVVLGGPDGISPEVREALRETVEPYADFPLLGIALPGGLLHSYYALANVLVFHDQGLLLPYLEAKAAPRPEAQEGPCGGGEQGAGELRPAGGGPRQPSVPPPAALLKRMREGSAAPHQAVESQAVPAHDVPLLLQRPGGGIVQAKPRPARPSAQRPAHLAQQTDQLREPDQRHQHLHQHPQPLQQTQPLQQQEEWQVRAAVEIAEPTHRGHDNDSASEEGLARGTAKQAGAAEEQLRFEPRPLPASEPSASASEAQPEQRLPPSSEASAPPPEREDGTPLEGAGEQMQMPEEPQVSREKGPPPEEAHFPSPPHGVQGSASPPISGPMPPSRMPQLFPRPKLPPRQGSWPSGGPRPPAQPPKQMALAIPSLRPQEVAKAKPRAPRMRGSVAVLLEDVETAL